MTTTANYGFTLQLPERPYDPKRRKEKRRITSQPGTPTRNVTLIIVAIMLFILTVKGFIQSAALQGQLPYPAIR